MNSIFIYLLKMAAGTAMFYICYLLFFRKETFYLRNRVFLILTLLLPAVIPVIRITVHSDAPAPLVTQDLFTDVVAEAPSAYTPVMAVSQPVDLNRIFLAIYFIVAAALLLKGLISIASSCRIILKGKVAGGKFPLVVVSEKQIPPFSFFPFVVIPAEEYNSGNCDYILDHESAHIRQGHTFDLLLSEFFTAVQWFNPFVWSVKRSVILNHEYLADRVSLCRADTTEYQYRLLNFHTGLKNISTVHSFNSLIKNRIIMINKKPTHRFAALKNLVILPVVASVAYAFVQPEYSYTSPATDTPLVIYSTPSVIQKEVKGIVLNEEGKPLAGVNIVSTGIQGESFHAETGADGRFLFTQELKPEASLIFICKGFKQKIEKPVFNSEMSVTLERNPEYKAPAGEAEKGNQKPARHPLIVVDGVITDKNLKDVLDELGYNRGIVNNLFGKEATDKYGEKGSDGVCEVTTREKALEMGLNPPYPRLVPDDYPTFQGNKAEKFSEWVASHAEYPAEARANNVEGWVTVKFNVEPDGSVSNAMTEIDDNTVLTREVIRVVNSSPKWEAPKNKSVEGAYSTTVTLRFKLPDRITNEIPYVIVEQMPEYPGGDGEIFNFITSNIRYPKSAWEKKAEGKVIVRFIVNTEGNVEAVSVRKGVSPELDAEAVRVVSLLKGFKPAMQGGKAVNVWYSMPITFSLIKTEAPK